MIKVFALGFAALGLATVFPSSAAAEKQFNVDGPMELHIFFTAKPGHEAELEKTFRQVFYPAVSSMDGYRDAAMVREADTSNYAIRLTFDSEEQRMEWVASDKHQKAWPAIEEHVTDVSVTGSTLIHPH